MKRRLKIWGIVLGIIVILGVVIAVVLHKWLNSSSTGVVHVGNPNTATQQAPTPLTITNHYYTTILPVGYTLKRQTESANNADTLVSTLAISGGSKDQQFAVTIATLPSAGLKAIGDYNLRVTQSDVYQPFQLPNLPSGAVAFRNTAGPATVTVFWPHDNLYAEIALSSEGATSQTQLNEVYAQAISSWQWKQ